MNTENIYLLGSFTVLLIGLYSSIVIDREVTLSRVFQLILFSIGSWVTVLACIITTAVDFSFENRIGEIVLWKKEEPDYIIDFEHKHPNANEDVLFPPVTLTEGKTRGSGTVKSRPRGPAPKRPPSGPKRPKR